MVESEAFYLNKCLAGLWCRFWGICRQEQRGCRAFSILDICLKSEHVFFDGICEKQLLADRSHYRHSFEEAGWKPKVRNWTVIIQGSRLRVSVLV